MHLFESESFKRSQSSTKNIHNLRPSILSRSNSQSSMSLTKKINHVPYSNNSIQKPSSVKVSFTYNQSGVQTSISVDESSKFDQSNDFKQEQKKQKKTFLNVISKDSVPEQIHKFVYGTKSSNFSKFIHPGSNAPASIQTLLASKMYHFDNSSEKPQSKREIQQIRSPLINESLMESFPNSKIKKLRNSSAVKSTEMKVQLSQNCKFQNQQIKPFTDFNEDPPVKQFDQKVQNMIQNQPQNENDTTFTAICTTQREPNQHQSKEIAEKLAWNDTIKLNELFGGNKNGENQNEKYELTNVQSTANQSMNPFSMSQNGEKANFKNQTQKISEFFLGDEEANLMLQKQKEENKNQKKAFCEDKSRQEINQVPVFEINLRDLSRLQENETEPRKIQRIVQKQIQEESRKTLIKELQEIQEGDRLGQNLNVLGMNIKELAQTIDRIPFKKDIRENERLKTENFQGQLTKDENTSKSSKQKTKQTFLSHEKTVEIKITGSKDQNSQKSYNRSLEKNKPCQSYIKEFIPVPEEQKSQNYNQKHVAYFYDQKLVGQRSYNVKSPDNQSQMAGSLEVLESHYQTGGLSSSLQQFYSIPQDSLEMSPQPSKILQNQPSAFRSTGSKYPESLFPELKSTLNINLIDQKKDSYPKTDRNMSPKKINAQKVVPFEKSYHKRKSLNQALKNYKHSNNSFLNSPQRKQKTYTNYLSTSQQNHQNSNFSNQKSPQDSNNSAKRQLNYEMYKIHRSKSVSKHYTKIATDQSKFRVIQLPLMENPVQIDGCKIVYPKYIKNKVYYVKG